MTSTGDIVVADSSNHRIRLVTPAGVVTTLAGSGSPGSTDGTGTGASFNNPLAVAVIPSSGNIVVSDTNNHRIRLITPAGAVTTLAGSGTPAFADAQGLSASFQYPSGVAVIPSTGDIIVGDQSNHRIRLITPAGVVTTLAGNGIIASTNGTGAHARFNHPTGVAVIPSTNVIVVADLYNHRIRLVTYPGGVVTTLAGTTAGFSDGTTGAQFDTPYGVAVIPSNGNIVVAEFANHRIRSITPAGVVTTLAGNGTAAFADGAGTSTARFSSPGGVAVTSVGDIVVADTSNHRIRLIV